MNNHIKTIIIILFTLVAIFLMINYLYGEIDSLIEYKPSFKNFVNNKRLNLYYTQINETLKGEIILTNTNRFFIKSPFIKARLISMGKETTVEITKYNTPNNNVLLFMGKIEIPLEIKLQKSKNYTLQVNAYEREYNQPYDELYEEKEFDISIK